MCEDRVPHSPTPNLKILYERYNEHLEQAKRGGRRSNVHLFGEICTAISSYWEDDGDATMTASDNNWPLQIDFESLPDRIIELKPEITGIISNEFVLDDSPAWKKFVENLKAADCKLTDFSNITTWSKFRAVGSNAHAG